MTTRGASLGEGPSSPEICIHACCVRSYCPSFTKKAFQRYGGVDDGVYCVGWFADTWLACTRTAAQGMSRRHTQRPTLTRGPTEQWRGERNDRLQGQQKHGLNKNKNKRQGKNKRTKTRTRTRGKGETTPRSITERGGGKLPDIHNYQKLSNDYYVLRARYKHPHLSRAVLKYA